MPDHRTTNDEQYQTRQPNRRTDSRSMTATAHDGLEDRDRTYLEKLRLAADVILQLGEDPGVIPNTLEVELWVSRDRVERALLQIPGATAGILPWHETTSGPSGDPRPPAG